MAQAQGFIPQTDQYTVPKGLDLQNTPQGGTAYKDTAGTYGQAGTLYIKGVNGYTLAPDSLPGNNMQPAGPGQGLGNVSSAAPTPNISVQPQGTTVRTAPTTSANGTPTPPPALDPLGPQGTALTSALEDAANAEGNGLGQVQTRGSSNSTDKNGNPVTTHENFSLSDALAKIGPAPTAPDTNTQETTLNASPGGVNDIQSNLNILNDNLTNLQNDLQNRQAQEASKPGVVRTIINGRMQMLSAEDSKALNDLKAQISDQTRQLTQAQTAVKSIMAASSKDYATAEKNYEFQYSKAMTQYQDEVNNENKAETTAKANAQVIINSYKGSSTGFNSITEDQKAQWGTLEMQAGLPPGTIEAAVKAELNITKFVKGSDGSMYVTGTDNNGIPYTAKVEGSYGSGSGAGNGSGKTAGKSDISGMSNELSSVAGKDGYISPQDWQTALNAWTKAGYSTASFITNFKEYANTSNPANKYAGIAKTAKGN